jgi:gamma-glutamyl:cysteine ligase YbdK (ATP-grasp superfamily)
VANRPVFDATGDGHIRIELRALPTGPTVADMAANAAFLVRTTLALADEWDLPSAMPFGAADANLETAARDGLEAEILWPSRESPSPVRRSLAEMARELLPAAARALSAHGVALDDVQERLQIVTRRIRTGQTGTAWQRRAVAALEPDLGRDGALVQMVRAFAANSAQGLPVAEWAGLQPA